MPNHEPRGCSRGASYSWYLYSASRIKYPMVRGRLIKAWREARKTMAPVEAWASIVGNAEAANSYKAMRGRGGFVRSTWDEVSEIIAAANVHTIKTWGPDRVVGFSPIPAMSMVSYASGARYLSLIGGTLLSFYDWYCDLPPSSPQTWGEQTDVPESADWYNSSYIIAWGSNVPQTRTPDAHFFVEARYNGTKVVAITPDYSEVAKLSDLWLHPKQGTDAALAMAMGHVILREFFLDRHGAVFPGLLPPLHRHADAGAAAARRRAMGAGSLCAAKRSARRAGARTAPPGRPSRSRRRPASLVVPQGSIGYRWPGEGEAKGRWNLEAKDGETGEEVSLALSVIDRRDEVLSVAFPYFGGKPHEHFPGNDQGGDVLLRNVPARRVALADGEAYVATVFDLLCANYGLDRGLGGACAKSFDDNLPYTPAWQEPITGVTADKAIAVARGFADNAEKTQGRSMVIIGAGMNHWYHQDMNYRSIINFLMMCGTIGISGGGWAHYVGQEKLRPQTGWTMLAFALDWVRPPRQMNGTSFFYAHSDQWRYEKLDVAELLSPLADPAPLSRQHDRSQRTRRAHGLAALGPAARRQSADARGRSGERPVWIKDSCRRRPESPAAIRMACEDPDNPVNFPRNLFIWRSNLFGSSGKGHEYFLRHFLGTRHGLQGKDLGETGRRQARGSHLARSGAGGKARPRRHPRFPHVDELPLLRRRACRRRPGTRRTISTRRICTPSSIRCRPPSIRSGNRAAIGKSIRRLRAASRSSPSVISASNATWC